MHSRDVGSRSAHEDRPPTRVVIGAVEPIVDGGRFPIKRVRGQSVSVRAVVFTEGHDRLRAVLRHRAEGDADWTEVAMRSLPNDRFEATFHVGPPGGHEYEVEAWVDSFATWRSGLEKKVEAGVDVSVELLEGAGLVEAAAGRAAEAGCASERRWLEDRARLLRDADERSGCIATAQSEDLARMMERHPDRSHAARTDRVLSVQVEQERARTGAWYEFFPRSTAAQGGEHGTFRDCEARLGYVARMGFDVVYLPPIHPIGRTHRKGRNNATTAEAGDPGSPWAIGSREGGHKSIHPDLGTFEDFDRFVARARDLGIEIALDIAFQCSPDHPYVREHPEWFRRRPDGSIQYAENPPKKYQDIYPLDFACEDWRALWNELASVFFFWIERGVTIFRVDNPHTKPFAFWEWVIREVRARHPEAVFLSEAFTRPAVMQHLAKAGFSQSYTYFTWRNTKPEIEAYFRELSSPPVSDYMRPNLFANTPDILPEYLQSGRRAAFQVRATLAALLANTWGVYGPPFELCLSRARHGSEDYEDSEKYEIRRWTLDDPWSLAPYLESLNEIRRAHPALREGGGPVFYDVDNREILAFGRRADAADETIVVVVNLDPHHAQSGWLTLPLDDLGIDGDRPFQAHDLLGGERYLWQGSTNFVELNPERAPAHVFRLRRRVRSENDFDYF